MTASIITRRTELASRRNALLVVVEKYLGLINCSVLHAKKGWTVIAMRLIDADEALRSLPDDLPYKDSVRRVLIQAPTVDAVRELT